MDRKSVLRPAARSRRGFSIVEMASVIAIVGIAAAIGAPRYWAALDRYGLDAAARRLAADLDLARRNASATSLTQTLSFIRDGGGDFTHVYTLAGMQSLDTPSAIYQVNLAAAEYRVAIVSASFGSDANVIFDRYGVPDSGGEVRLSRGGYQKRIVLDATTGKVSIL